MWHALYLLSSTGPRNIRVAAKISQLSIKVTSKLAYTCRPLSLVLHHVRLDKGGDGFQLNFEENE